MDCFEFGETFVGFLRVESANSKYKLWGICGQFEIIKTWMTWNMLSRLSSDNFSNNSVKIDEHYKKFQCIWVSNCTFHVDLFYNIPSALHTSKKQNLQTQQWDYLWPLWPISSRSLHPHHIFLKNKIILSLE